MCWSRSRPDPDEPIVKLPNVITFPHIGTATEETRRAMRGLAVTNVVSVVSGQTPPGLRQSGSAGLGRDSPHSGAGAG